MDVQPPRDANLRNIIDKLAEFVARNGPEFEAITKQKQQGNPKFDFLYGGEFATYYQYRVAAEQAMLKQQGIVIGTQMPTGAAALYHQQQQSPMQQQPPSHYTQATQQPQQQQQSPNVHENTQYNMQTPQQQQAPQHLWPTNSGPPLSTQASNGTALAMNLSAQVEAISMQQTTLREQIKQSEANLSAQHTALMTQKTKQIEEAMATAQSAQMEQLATEQSIVLRDFDAVLQPIIESCTKDSISAGKNWILQHSTDNAKINVVLQYLLKKALVNGSTFQQKLHLIYLVNDILHHCMRKNITDLKNSLENVVIPMFCSADLIATNDQRQKLTKLLSLWESKAKFFDACVISKLQAPDSSMQEYKTNLQNTHHEIVTKYTQTTKATLDNYQKQHQIFMQHAKQQIAQLEQQKQQLEKQMLVAQSAQQQQQPPPTTPQKSIPALMSQRIIMPGAENEHVNAPTPQHDHGQAANNVYAANAYQQQQPQQQQQQQQPNHYMDPRGPNFFIPDMSKPPPGFQTPMHPGMQQPQQQLPPQYGQMPLNNMPPGQVSGEPTVDLAILNAAIQRVHQLQQQQQQHIVDDGHPAQQQQPQQLVDLQQKQPPLSDGDNSLESPAPVIPEEPQIPTAPYYDLPAGLMVPLIRLEDYNYKSLDPTEIRLPAPTPQNERLTNALNAFYAAPSHDHPRDNEGWEKLGLYEYYKVKNAARKQKEEDVKNGTREKSRSPSPIVLEKPKPKKPNKRCYRSKSRSRSRSHTPPRRSRTRSRSPEGTPPSQRSRGGGNSNSSSKSRNRSPRHERDQSNNSRDNRAERNSSSNISLNNSGSNNNNGNGNNNSSRRVERDRSPTPPSFFGSSFAKPNEFIEESNKGHQMLMKMGWGGTGTGLGSKNQGIDAPISGGEVRDRRDMYKGVGNNLNDPFESFRKNKGAAFVHRMRARDDKS
ncbi:calcium homeostasis endoplasmic reticulum protein [Scaptodrosophila lebanonensis]|uniref:Calcium homeostasis endoplasmic reticulum protein n=1 Tax=Drosophila lebanonensis TaxID=7225 RepID=A0A6J2UBA6_DROLE|nr:calcium homeostasis endoplasmic reticulum protein [Scaptodrosophila lebanonensis]